MSELKFFDIETLGDPNDEHLCVLHDTVSGLERYDWKLIKGERVLSHFPAVPKIFMSPESKGVKLSAFLGNTKNMFVVSRPFKEAIEKHCAGVDIEYLPFTLHDHRKRVRSQDYFIINPIGGVDCLDVVASGVKYGSEGGVIGFDELVLDRDKVKNAPQLFRVSHRPAHYLVGVELAREIYDQDFSNVLWQQLRFSDEPETEDEG